MMHHLNDAVEVRSNPWMMGRCSCIRACISMALYGGKNSRIVTEFSGGEL